MANAYKRKYAKTRNTATMSLGPMLQAHDFLYELERRNFSTNQITIVRLEMQVPAKRTFLELAQEGLGDVTTQIGRFSWTKFKGWELAFNFYMQHHGRYHQNEGICAQPVSVPGFNYEQLMEAYKPRHDEE